MMDMSAVYPDSPLEQDDVPFPCKGCGEVHHSPLVPILSDSSAPIADPLIFFM